MAASESSMEDERGNARIPTSRQPTEDELAGAFDDAGGEARPKKQLSGTGTVRTSAPSGDPRAPLRSNFEQQEAEAKRLLAQKSPDAVMVGEDLVRLGQQLEPEYSARALSLRAEIARVLRDENGAWQFSRKWLLACGPQNPDRCRTQALAAMSKNAQGPNQKKVVSDVRAADKCARSVETAGRKGPSKLPDCFASAHRLFRQMDDDLMTLRMEVARGQWKLKTGESDEGIRELERADRQCTAPRCSEVRRRGLKLLVSSLMSKGDVEGAARAALKDVKLNAELLPPDQRLWAWTREADRACEALDKANGAGACRKLERTVVGFHSFRDFSRDASSVEGLTPDVVRTVNGHYGVTLEECLAREARRLNPPAQERYTMTWVVTNEGRIAEMHMEKKDHENGPLAQCFREKLSVWRYPRYDGEFQHVSQTFHVSAVRR